MPCSIPAGRNGTPFPETDLLPDPQEKDPTDSRDVAVNAVTGVWTSSEVLMRWMLYLLLFKLMFLSGITKMLSGDETWAAGTALEYYYETQPSSPLDGLVHAPASCLGSPHLTGFHVAGRTGGSFRISGTDCLATDPSGGSGCDDLLSAQPYRDRKLHYF